MISQVVIGAMALLGGAAAQGAAAAENQLETPRLTQAAQRAEFGVEGDASAFKFSFSDPVRSACQQITSQPCVECSMRSFCCRHA